MRNYLKEILRYFKKRPLIPAAVLVCLAAFVMISAGNGSRLAGQGSFDLFIYKVERSCDGNSKIYGYDRNFGRVLVEGELGLGTCVSGEGTYRTFQSASNPGTFDQDDYMNNKGVSGKVTLNRISEQRPSRAGELIDKLRYLPKDIVFEQLKRSAGEEDTALLSAFCLGDSSLLDNDIKRDFKLTGCSHLLAVSGSHFSSFLIVLPIFYEIFRVPRKRRKLIHLLLVIVIGTMTGWKESVTRAAFMSIAMLFSRDMMSGMSFAAIIMVITEPYTVMSQGFRMSFGAVLGMRLTGGEKDNKLKEAALAMIGANIGILPFSADTYLSLSPALFIGRALAGVILQFVCVFFVFGVLLSPISGIFLMPSALAARTVCKVVAAFVPFYFDVPTFGELGIAAMAGTVLLVILIRFRKDPRLLFIPILLITIGAAGYVIDRRDDRVVFIDVGQGDCCLIMSNGRSCLIDGGKGENAGRIGEVLDHYRVEKVDLAIMTHWDEDHAGGIIELSKTGRLKRIFTSYTGSNAQTERILEEHEAELTVEPLTKGDLIRFGDQTVLEVIWPQETTDGENADSVVAVLDSHGFKLLFTGDIDTDTEAKIGKVDADVIKVAHHGSRTSTGNEFLDDTTPLLAIISVGPNNYGHPTEDVLQRLADHGVTVMRTDLDGAVELRINKKKVEANTFLNSKNRPNIVRITKD